MILEWWERLMARRCAKVGHDLGPRHTQPSGRVWRYCYRCGGVKLVHDPSPYVSDETA